MKTKRNNHRRPATRVFVRVLSRGLAVLLPIAILLTIAFQVQADPRAIMGGGNFTNGDTGAVSVNQYNALITLGAKMCRMNLYPSNYWNGSAAVPTLEDSAVLQAHGNDITPMILFEYYGSYNNLGDYNKWFAIGRDFATRFRPNSPWLTGQNINGWGITVYSAINEPDIDNLIPKTGSNSYYSALEGLADGVHSVDASLKVIPGGFASENAYSSHTLNGYGTAIAPLLNSGKLDGIDLHTYNDISFAPIVRSDGSDTFDFSPQSDFDSVKSACGITRDINFYCTEFNFKNDSSQDIDENLAAKRFLTTIWANLGVVKNDGSTRAGQFAFPWNIFLTAEADPTYGLNTQLNPWTPRARGTTLKLVLDKSAGMEFVTLDPKGRGEFILNGNNRKMWVWQNYPTWSSISGTSYTVSGIPAGATKLEVYGWDGLRNTILLSGQTSYSVTGLTAKETYMFLVDAATPVSSSTIKINFQTSSTTTPTGYLPDSGLVYGDRGNGYSYGWDADTTGQARERDSASSPDKRYDTFIAMYNSGNGFWEIAVPNGTYSVHVVAGDADYYDDDSVFKINVEGVLTVNGTPSSNTHWIEGTQTVTVSDGRLTVTNAPGNYNNKICFIDIALISTSRRHRLLYRIGSRVLRP